MSKVSPSGKEPQDPKQPPPAGSFEEAKETAKIIGYPGAVILIVPKSKRQISLMLWREA